MLYIHIYIFFSFYYSKASTCIYSWTNCINMIKDYKYRIFTHETKCLQSFCFSYKKEKKKKTMELIRIGSCIVMMCGREKGMLRD